MGKVSNAKEFHQTVLHFKETVFSEDKCLTTKLTSKEGKMDGRVVTIVKDLLYFFTRIKLSQTAPEKVAQALARFALIHKDFVNEESKRVLLGTFQKLEQSSNLDTSDLFTEINGRMRRHLKGTDSIRKEFEANNVSPLWLTVLENDVNTAQKLVLEGSNFDDVESYGELPDRLHGYGSTPIDLALYLGHIEMVKFLLPRNPDSKWLNQALYKATENNDAKMVKLLLSHGADRFATYDKSGKIPLHVAAMLRKKLVKILLTEETKDTPDARGVTPRAFAANNSRTTKFLIKKGVKVPTLKEDLTPLAYALRTGNTKSFSLLFPKNGDINTKNSKGKTLLSLALKGHQISEDKQIAMVKMLLEKGADPLLPNAKGKILLHQAARLGKEKLFKLLYSEKLKNAKGKHDNTPLYYAIVGGNKKIVRFLLREGVDSKICNDAMTPPLHLAILSGKLSLVELLFEQAEKDVRDFDGNTLINFALKNSANPRILKYLIDKHINVNIPDHRGLTPLAVAVKKKNHAVAKTLIMLGADPAIPNRNGNFPFHKALKHKDFPMLELLFTNEIANQKGANGLTPIHQALRLRDITLVHYLVSKGVDLSIRDPQGDLPVDYALKHFPEAHKILS